MMDETRRKKSEQQVRAPPQGPHPCRARSWTLTSAIPLAHPCSCSCFHPAARSSSLLIAELSSMLIFSLWAASCHSVPWHVPWSGPVGWFLGTGFLKAWKGRSCSFVSTHWSHRLDFFYIVHTYLVGTHLWSLANLRAALPCKCVTYIRHLVSSFPLLLAPKFRSGWQSSCCTSLMTIRAPI